MKDTQRIDKSLIRRTVLALATLTVDNRAPTAAMGHSDLRPLRLKPAELRQLGAFLRTLSGPIVAGGPTAARRTQ